MAIVALMAFGCFGGLLARLGRSSRNSPAPPAPSAPTPVPEPCPDGYAELIMREMRDRACPYGGRRGTACLSGVQRMISVQPECFVGARRVTVISTFTNEPGDVAVAKQLGTEAYHAVRTNGPDTDPHVEVKGLSGGLLCANFAGGPRCMSRLGEVLERW